MEKVEIKTYIPSCELSTIELVQRIKTMSDDPQIAYGLFVKERTLIPEINAKEFNNIWNSVLSDPHIDIENVSFIATHIDRLTNKLVQITDGIDKLYLLWENGSSGTDPRQFFDTKRYEIINKDNCGRFGNPDGKIKLCIKCSKNDKLICKLCLSNSRGRKK